MSDNTKLNTETQWMHIFAFRYALGRSSTAPGIVCDYMTEHIKDYTTFNLQLFDEEISKYLEQADLYKGDTACWIELQVLIREELKVRPK